MKRLLCLFVLIGLVGCGESPQPKGGDSADNATKVPTLRQMTIIDENGMPKAVTVPDGNIPVISIPYAGPQKAIPQTGAPVPPPATKGPGVYE